MNFNFSHKVYIFLLFPIFLFSCQENSRSIYLLEQAQNIVETDPVQALLKIDSISNPEEMEKDYYMQYIVTKVQAKYKTYQDVTGDTLIFEAQKYFEKNSTQAILANLYAGSVYREKQMPEKALECYFQANEYARQANDNLLIGRSLHNISYLYYDQDVMDSVIVYGQKTFDHYNKITNADLNKLELMNLIGWAYKVNNNLDSAANYFSKGIELANKIDNKVFEATFTHSLGVVYRDQKKYSKAVEYLHQALAQTTDTEDSVRVYLNLTKTYNHKKQLDSARHYTSLLKDQISKITYDYSLLSTYKALLDYNQQSGNYKEALYYANLATTINEKITNANSSQKLIETSNNYQLSLKDTELKNQRLQYTIIGIFFILILSLIAFFKYSQMRYQHKKEKDLLETQNQLLKLDYNAKNQEIDSLIFLQGIYQNILNEWATIETKAAKLVKKYMMTEEPSINQLIKELRADVRIETNHHLKEWALNYLQKELMSENQITTLEDDELILLVLSYCRYSTKNIAAILNLPQKQNDIENKRIQIRNKLLDVGLSESLIDDLLFGTNREHDFQN